MGFLSHLLILLAIGLFDSVVVSGLNIDACRFRWRFPCIGVWKLTISFTLSSINCYQFVFPWKLGNDNRRTYKNLLANSNYLWKFFPTLPEHYLEWWALCRS